MLSIFYTSNTKISYNFLIAKENQIFRFDYPYQLFVIISIYLSKNFLNYSALLKLISKLRNASNVKLR